jgi:release factor glutamine methyltransferase
VRDYEPRGALDGGPDGLAVIRKLIPQAAEALNAGGWLVLELGEDQSPRVTEMISADPSFDADSIETATDAGGCERVLAVRKGR